MRHARKSRALTAHGRILGSRLRHLTAGFGTATAHVGALLHHVVVFELIARRRARDAHLGAHFARAAVEFGIEQHEPRAGIADLCAGEQCLDVIGRSVFTALVPWPGTIMS